MIGKFVFLALFGVAFGRSRAPFQGFALSELNDLQETYGEEDTVRKLTEEGEGRVVEMQAKIAEAPKIFNNITDERVGCLTWEYTLIKKTGNQTVTEAVFKGMLKNKSFNNFQCIATASEETFGKIDAIMDKVPEGSRQIKEKSLSQVRMFGLIMPGLATYTRDLAKHKIEELNKAGNPNDKKKIVKEVEEKMKLLNTILNQVNDRFKGVAAKFFEEHTDFIFRNENDMKKAQREGAQKTMKCVA